MDSEKRKAKIQMEKEKIQAAKADAKAKSKKKKKEPTTPVARAGTPPRGKAGSAATEAVGAPEPEPEPEPGSVAPAAVVAAKRKASIAKEAAKRKKALQEQRAAKKRAATPERKADDSKPKASAAAERKAALQKERQKRAEAAASDGAAPDAPSQPGGKANGTKAKADPVTPTARPADAAPKPTVTSVAGTSRKATSVAKSTKPTKSKKESKADAIAAKKEEIKRKRALKAKGAGAASDAEPGKADEAGEEPPPLPPGEQRARPQPAKAKSAQGKRKKAPATPRQEPAPEPAPDAAPLDPADILRRLHAAADGGDEAALATAVAQATKAGVDLNAPDPTRDDCTAVYLAAQRGHHRLVERLAQNGADLMLPGAMDATPLFIASYHGFDRVVGVIADNLPTNKVWRAVRNHRDADGREIVRPGDVFKPDTKKADRAGLYEGVLLGSDQQWPRAGDEWAKLPGDLFESVTEREIQLEKRVDDSSPFFIACQEGNKKVVEVLFEAGVDVEAPDGQGATPFYSACQQGKLDVVQYLFGKENPRSGDILDPERGITVNGVMETPIDTAKRWRRDAVVTFLSEPYSARQTNLAATVPASSDAPPPYRDDPEEESDTDDEKDLLRKMPGVDLRAVVGAVGLAAGGWGDPGEGLSQGDAESLRGDIGALQQEESDKLKKIKRGKTKTLDLAMRRRGSVYSAGFLVEEDESEEFEADGEEEDETRLRLTQLTRVVIFVGISVFAILAHFAPGLLVLTAILTALLIAAPAHYANADAAPGLPGGKTQRSLPAVQLGLCLFISIFAGAAQFVPGVLVILSTLILLLLAAPASKDDGTKKHTWR